MVVTLRAPPLTDAVGDFGHGDVGDVNFGDARKAKAPLLLEGGVRVVGDEACKEEGGGGEEAETQGGTGVCVGWGVGERAVGSGRARGESGSAAVQARVGSAFGMSGGVSHPSFSGPLPEGR